MRTLPYRHWTGIVLFALLAWPAVLWGAPAVVLSGFTRPGSPSDPEIDGKIKPITFQEQPDVMGGTVSFMVLERKGEGLDPWETGVKDFVQHFLPGIDFGGSLSPGLDSKAKYLYLYQTHNDRRTETPIHSATIKLLVETKHILSWGSFRDLSFGLPGEKQEIRAVTYRPVSDDDTGRLAYRRRAPSLTHEPFLFLLVPSTTAKGEIFYPAKGKEKKPLATREDITILPAFNPDIVMLLDKTADFRDRPGFRAIWSKEGLPKDRFSTVYGFTSNLPPAMEPVLLKALVKAEKKEDSGIRLIATDPDTGAVGPAGPVAEGRVPTPRPENPVVNYPPSLDSFVSTNLSTPQQPGGGLVGGGGGPPTFGGGGGGTGGEESFLGNGNAQNPIAREQSQEQQGSDNPINFNVTLTNQQTQSQEQNQTQNQSQDGCCCNVIPQPASLILTVLGLPAFWWLHYQRRRRKQAGRRTT